MTTSKLSICTRCNKSFIIKTGAKGIYCSHACSSIGRKILSQELATKQRIKKERRYVEYPNFCRNCNNILQYSARKNKFCSKNCAATFNNTGRVRSDESKKKISIILSSMIKSGQLPKTSSTKAYKKSHH